MWYSIIGFIIGFFCYDLLFRRKENRISIELETKKESQKSSDLDYLKRKISVEKINAIAYDITQSWKDLSGLNTAHLCFEGPAKIGIHSHFVAYLSDYKARIYIVNNKVTSFKIIYRFLSTSPNEFNYYQIEIFLEGNSILKATYRDFQHDNADWFEVDFISKESLDRFIQLVN